MTSRSRPNEPSLRPPEIGMLEYFAGQALAGLAANPNFNAGGPLEVEATVNRAWALAVEMVKFYQSTAEK